SLLFDKIISPLTALSAEARLGVEYMTREDVPDPVAKSCRTVADLSPGFRVTVSASARGKIKRQHQEDHSGELEDDAPAHQGLRSGAGAAAHHVEKAK